MQKRIETQFSQAPCLEDLDYFRISEPTAKNLLNGVTFVTPFHPAFDFSHVTATEELRSQRTFQSFDLKLPFPPFQTHICRSGDYQIRVGLASEPPHPG